MKAKVLVLAMACWVSACNGQVTSHQMAGNQPDDATERSMELNEPASIRPSFAACLARDEGTTPGMQACIEEERSYHEARMNAAIESLRKSGAESSQPAWQDRVSRECSWDPKTEGQAQMVEAEYCRLMRTASRADELQEMLGTGN